MSSKRPIYLLTKTTWFAFFRTAYFGICSLLVSFFKFVNRKLFHNVMMCIFIVILFFFSFGPMLTFTSSSSKWFKLFPGIRPKSTTLKLILMFPVWREMLLGVGCVSAAANAITTLLNQSNDPDDRSNCDGYTANAVGLIVGGAEESFHTRANTYKFVLKNRKGFAKIALKTGASLVPSISFGENDVYDLIEFQPGSLGRSLQNLFKRCTTFAPLMFNGRGYLQYNIGLLPKRHPINVVIGAPIHTEKRSEPTADDIDQLHNVFCVELEKLFETHKRKYIENADNVQLEII